MIKNLRNHFFYLPILAILACFLMPSVIYAGAVRSGFTANSLAANDDGSTGQVDIGFPINFFGINQRVIYINNNGNITFTGAQSAYVPSGLSGGAYKIIAPYWGDVDTRTGALVTYGAGTVNGRLAYGVNWVGVKKFPGTSASTISCQLVIIERGDTGIDNFDFELNYDSMNWAPGGVGWSNGNYGGNNVYYENTSSYGQLASLSNCDVAGRYTFTVREGSVVATTVIVTPSTAILTIPDTLALSAAVSPANADQSVTWSSSDTANASVSSSGVVTAIRPGVVTITATSLATEGVTGTSTITVLSRDNVLFFGTGF
jgi:hypothetical protein